ncbi:MAG: sel1 repeat family protein [Desulfarculus sp.]|nr:sel1 repeat family protein [Desulfarculus sp.]
MTQRLILTSFIVLLFLAPAVTPAAETTAETINFWKERAKRGSATTPFQLGLAYQKGEGVLQDKSEAAKWYSLGAQRGDLQAALMLAKMYSRGEGVQKNEEKAIELFVDIGKSDSVLGSMARCHLLIFTRNYSLGNEGIMPDREKARYLFERLGEIEIAIMDKKNKQMDKLFEEQERILDSIK